jgi:hypothetical protein
MKLFNRTPADLPPSLKADLCSWLSEAPAAVEGHIRPGCVHLTMQLLVSRRAHDAAKAAGLASLVAHLLDGSTAGAAFWRSGVYTVQVFSQLAVVEGGVLSAFEDHEEPVGTTPAQRQRLRNRTAPRPVVSGLSVLCVAAGSGSGSGPGCFNSSVTLYGQALDLPGLEIIYVDETTFHMWQSPSRVWQRPGMTFEI